MPRTLGILFDPFSGGVVFRCAWPFFVFAFLVFHGYLPFALFSGVYSYVGLELVIHCAVGSLLILLSEFHFGSAYATAEDAFVVKTSLCHATITLLLLPMIVVTIFVIEISPWNVFLLRYVMLYFIFLMPTSRVDIFKCFYQQQLSCCF